MRRIANLVWIIGLLGAVVALAGCSAIKLGYNSMPQVSAWWLDGYLDLPDEQEQRARDDLSRLHQWHRRQELPKIGALLQQAERMAVNDLTADEVCALVPPIRLRLSAIADQAEPAAVTLVLALQPEQLTQLQRKYEKNNREFRKDWLDLPVQELRDKRFKQQVDRLETFYGRLQDSQRDVIRGQIERGVFNAETSLRERQRRQQDILQTLRQLAGQPVSLPDARSAIHQLVQRTLRSPDARYRSYEEALVKQSCGNLAALHQTTTPQQRQSAVRRLRAYQRDLDDLAAEP